MAKKFFDKSNFCHFLAQKPVIRPVWAFLVADKGTFIKVYRGHLSLLGLGPAI
jgi:hypothetical protein